MSNWKLTPSISGRVATEEDIANGIAVFSIPSGSSHHETELPLCAVQIDSDTGKRIPCIAIQIEEAPEGIFVGVRYLSGGNGVGSADEFEFYSEPNHEFGI